MDIIRTDVLIVGGGLGGVAGALAALRLGRTVVLTEETDWIGGQLTTQALPPDEHRWIEKTGCSMSYRQLRNRIRDYYRRNYPLRQEVLHNPHLNPGMGWVSGLCHEPRVALAVLEEILAPYLASGRLHLLLRHRPYAVDTDGDYVESVYLNDEDTGSTTCIEASYFLDATELGDLLPLANTEHTFGAEGQEQTGEPHAQGRANPMDQQAITWSFPLGYDPNEDHTIPEPEKYDFWRGYRASFWPDRQLSWTYPDPSGGKDVTRYIFAISPSRKIPLDLWHYRRIICRDQYEEGTFSSDVTMVNWPQTDYWLGPIIGVSDSEKSLHLQRAKQLCLSFLFWMQTEAPRPEGGLGYPGLHMRTDVVGTRDGMAKHVYIRESRRIQAMFTVLEQHIAVEARGALVGSEIFADTVGVGCYRIDLHPSTSGRSYIDISSWPFQIPLGSLIPVRVENLLPSCKNAGVTHITNGCYRVHPVEWSIGEAAGALAAYCIANGVIPRQVRESPVQLLDFQRLLQDDLGFQLQWPEEIRRVPLIRMIETPEG